MSKLHFRCINIEKDEKTMTQWAAGERTTSKVVIVNCQFDCVDMSESKDVHSHGFLSITLPLEEYQKYGYDVGQVYELAPT